MRPHVCTYIKSTGWIEVTISLNCRKLSIRPADTNCKNASHSSPGADSYTGRLPPSPHPPALDEMRPEPSACPTNPISRPLRTDQCTDETSDRKPPKSAPLPPVSSDPHSIQNTSPQIASSGSPVASPSVSSVTSIGDHNKPDRLCATKPDRSRVTNGKL